MSRLDAARASSRQDRGGHLACAGAQYSLLLESRGARRRARARPHARARDTAPRPRVLPANALQRRRGQKRRRRGPCWNSRHSSEPEKWRPVKNMEPKISRRLRRIPFFWGSQRCVARPLEHFPDRSSQPTFRSSPHERSMRQRQWKLPQRPLGHQTSIRMTQSGSLGSKKSFFVAARAFTPRRQCRSQSQGRAAPRSPSRSAPPP